AFRGCFRLPAYERGRSSFAENRRRKLAACVAVDARGIDERIAGDVFRNALLGIGPRVAGTLPVPSAAVYTVNIVSGTHPRTGPERLRHAGPTGRRCPPAAERKRGDLRAGRDPLLAFADQISDLSWPFNQF